MYKKIVLAGGGVKGLAYLGVLKFLKEKDILKDIDTFVGCSIGSLACLLIILDYPYTVLKKVMDSYDMTNLNYPSVQCIINNMCLNEGINIEKFIKTFIINAGYDSQISMKRLYDLTNKTLVVSVTDIKNKKNILMSKEEFPDIPVYLAVRISMSIPFVYTPVVYKGNIYCDGCISSNFPVKYFTGKGEEVISCHFSSQMKKEVGPSDTFILLNNVIKTPTFINEKLNIEYAEKNQFKVVNIEIPETINNLNFSLSQEQKNYLYDSGYNSCVKVLK